MAGTATKARKPTRSARVSVQQTLTRDDLREQFESHATALDLRVEVFSNGPIHSNIAVIGEGPGETEVRKGLPFVGGAGTILFNGLGRFGLHRDNVYVSNVVKRQISLSRKGNERHVVHADELEKWTGMLQWELAQLPNVDTVLVLGNYALDALCSVQGITKWRGSVLTRELPNGRIGKVVCTFNPAYVTYDREPRFEPIFQMDCGKLDMVRRGVFCEHRIEEIINPTVKEIKAFLRDLRKARLPVGYDIEAAPGAAIDCIGVANDPHKAMCINFRDEVKNRFTVSEEAEILCAVQELCESNRMVGQNAQFDAYFSRLYSLLRIRFWMDILLAHHALYPRLPHSLAFMVSQYTNHPYYKDEGKLWKEGGDINTRWRYNCKDVALTIACANRLIRELKQQGQEKFFFDHVMRAQPHLVEATVHGVKADLSVKGVITEQVQKDVAEALARFHHTVHELTGDPDYNPNPNSPKQMRELLFDHLGLVGRGQSTDEDNRKEIMKHPRTSPLAKEMLTQIDRFKEEDKFRGTYAESKVCEDGRFRCEYSQFGVAKAPGRLSSKQLLVTKEGGNMQNQPMKARGMFVADPECVFVYFDLAQAEAQVVSFRADIPKWKEQFARARIDGSYDCHRALAADMFRLKYESIPIKDFDEFFKPTKRYVAKRCRHGLNYRMERHRLSQVTELPYHEASHAFILYHGATPELRQWWEEEERQFRKNREVFNALGRRFKVVQRIGDDVLESIIAFYPQSTIGDKIVQVWYQAEEDDDWPDSHQARVAIDVHDNLVAICTPKVAKTAMRILKEYAESPIYIQDVYKRRKAEPLSIPAELKMSYPTSWSEKAVRDASGEWQPGFVPDEKNGLHRWSDMKVVKL